MHLLFNPIPFGSPLAIVIGTHVALLGETMDRDQCFSSLPDKKLHN
jgi:hypothetical protein